MNEHELFTQPHDELLRIATDLGIANVSVLTKGQLVHAIAVVQAAQKQGRPWAQTPKVVFRPEEQMQTALVHNPADRPVRLSLEVVDGNEAFTIPAEFKDVVLQGRDALSLPVRFSPSIKGIPMTTSAPYAAGIHVWDREANCIVARVHLLATGPGYQTASCALSPQPEGSRDEEPPKIYLEVKPEWTETYQQNVHIKYRISGASEVMEDICQTNSWILEDNEAIDTWCYSYPVSPNLNKEFDIANFGSHSFLLYARNASGQTRRGVSIPVLQPIGYSNARTPLPVYRSTINALLGFLNKIKEKIGDIDRPGGCIHDNTWLDQFSNSSYLRGELTNDILNKMNDVIIFTNFSELPSVGRYVINFDNPNNPTNWWLREIEESKRLCYWNPADRTGRYGATFYVRDQVGLHRDWGTSLCYQNYPPKDPIDPVGDPMTLLHELYHYAVREDQIIWDPVVVDVPNYQTGGTIKNAPIEEAKAYVVSCSLLRVPDV